MDFSFGDEEKALADSFRDFIRREVKPVEEQLRPLLVESDDPPELRDELLKIRRSSADLGFYSVDIPTEFGGGGVCFAGPGAVAEGGGCPGPRSSLGVPRGHAGVFGGQEAGGDQRRRGSVRACL